MVDRKRNALTALMVKAQNKRGKYADGGGLYLRVSEWGGKSWLYRYQLNGKRHEMHLGSLPDYSLAEARQEVKKHREIVRTGKDPKLLRDAAKQVVTGRQYWTFDKCAQAYIDAHSPSWKNAKHAQQWRNTLRTYASPILGDLPVEEINTPLIMRVIEPIWLTKTETATRVRGRVERVLSWAIVNNYRDHPNPAAWRGNLQELLPERSKVAKVIHHPAMPYNEIALFMGELTKLETISAKALQFTILTACRTSEVIEASWDEIDLKEAVWTIPKERAKAERDHRVPLTPELIDLLVGLPKLDGWVFPSPRAGNHISNLAMLKLLQKTLKRPDFVVHGFRSTFRDWAAEVSSFPRELAEAALAHVLADKTEAAYQRGDLLEKRRKMMEAWSEYAKKQDDKITSMKERIRN